MRTSWTAELSRPAKQKLKYLLHRRIVQTSSLHRHHSIQLQNPTLLEVAQIFETLRLVSLKEKRD
jgi:hypothetical protein